MGEYLSTPIKKKNSEDGENEEIKYGACGMQGWRKSMEDTHIANLKIAEGVSLFGVFDGHGGKEVALFVKKHYTEELQKLESFKKGEYKVALIESFLKMDVLMLTEDGRKELMFYKKQGGDKESPLYRKMNGEDSIAYNAGCTACVALITKDEVYVANAGDSRCVASRKGTAIELSTDHKPDLASERKRIENAGGFVEEGRVNAALSLSRALGDFEYKDNPNLTASDQIVTSFPEVHVEKRTDIGFLIIACDGIWDCLTSQEAVGFVAERLGRLKKDKFFKVSRISEIMFDDILATNVAKSGGIGCDNMTCVVVLFN